MGTFNSWKGFKGSFSENMLTAGGGERAGVEKAKGEGVKSEIRPSAENRWIGSLMHVCEIALNGGIKPRVVPRCMCGL